MSVILEYHVYFIYITYDYWYCAADDCFVKAKAVQRLISSSYRHKYGIAVYFVCR